MLFTSATVLETDITVTQVCDPFVRSFCVTDNFKDFALDEIGQSLGGLMGLLGSYVVFYLFEFAALIARVIMMARRGTVPE